MSDTTTAATASGNMQCSTHGEARHECDNMECSIDIPDHNHINSAFGRRRSNLSRTLRRFSTAQIYGPGTMTSAAPTAAEATRTDTEAATGAPAARTDSEKEEKDNKDLVSELKKHGSWLGRGRLRTNSNWSKNRSFHSSGSSSGKSRQRSGSSSASGGNDEHEHVDVVVVGEEKSRANAGAVSREYFRMPSTLSSEQDAEITDGEAREGVEIDLERERTVSLHGIDPSAAAAALAPRLPPHSRKGSMSGALGAGAAAAMAMALSSSSSSSSSSTSSQAPSPSPPVDSSPSPLPFEMEGEGAEGWDTEVEVDIGIGPPPAAEWIEKWLWYFTWFLGW